MARKKTFSYLGGGLLCRVGAVSARHGAVRHDVCGCARHAAPHRVGNVSRADGVDPHAEGPCMIEKNIHICREDTLRHLS